MQNSVEHVRLSFFVKIVNGWKSLTIFTKSSFIDWVMNWIGLGLVTELYIITDNYNDWNDLKARYQQNAWPSKTFFTMMV